MPRTDAVAPPGCPPLRALSFDSLGLVKVIESSTENGYPQVVARWGQPSSQRSIVSVSLSTDEGSEVLAVARRNFNVEILDPSDGALYAEVNTRTVDGCGNPPNNSDAKEGAALIGVHLFRAEASGLRSVLTCTGLGCASLQSCNMKKGESERPEDASTAASWAVCKMGSILCLKVDRSEKYAAFGGDGADATLWDIQTQSRIWEAKAPRRDNNGLMSRPFVTASTFLGNDHRKLIIGTGHHQVRLYDIGATRRPMMAFDFLESPIKAVEADTDGNTVFVGTGNGDLASFDMRSGKLLGSFKGKVSGSIRSIAVHPTLPVFATCGLDRFLRVFHKSSRQLLARVFLKQPLVATIFDTNYPRKSPVEPKHVQGIEEKPEVENDAEDSLETARTVHNKESKKRRLGEQRLKVPKKKKGDSSTLDSDTEQVHEEDLMVLMKECAKAAEPSQNKKREEPITNSRKSIKLKREQFKF